MKDMDLRNVNYELVKQIKKYLKKNKKLYFKNSSAIRNELNMNTREINQVIPTLIREEILEIRSKTQPRIIYKVNLNKL